MPSSYRHLFGTHYSEIVWELLQAEDLIYSAPLCHTSDSRLEMQLPERKYRHRQKSCMGQRVG